jgi:hypothetical protein
MIYLLMIVNRAIILEKMLARAKEMQPDASDDKGSSSTAAGNAEDENDFMVGSMIDRCTTTVTFHST